MTGARFGSTWWTPISSATKLRVGRLLKAHGLKGALKLELYTDSPETRFVKGAVLELQVPESSPWFGKRVTVTELRWYNQVPVLFLEEVTDRNLAESIVKAILLIDADPENETPEPDAWYDHQLVGLTARVAGSPVGKVVRVEHLPAQDLLIVKTEAGEVMVPFVKQMVPSVDLVCGIVELTPPPGLFDAEAAEEAR